ncbi:putative diguanylate cyclase YegE [mine drainage metagenome]|uniref:Putative diguanylate cyclase YegE n=1 Tax=mine drainage metagenome TaxID=410659 RepID=A0A1J5R7G5_9ZZZZ
MVSCINTVFFTHLPLSESLQPSGIELYMRLLVSLLIVVIGYMSSRLAQRRIEADFLKNDAQLHHIIETSLDGFWIIDQQGGFLEVNDAYCLMIGYQREELLNMNIIDVEAMESPEVAIRHIEQIIKTGADRFETKHRRKDGYVLDIEVSASYGQDGQFYCFLHDVTRRKRSEVELKDSEFRWKFAIEGTGDGVWDWDIETNQAKYSTRWKEMLGYSESDTFPTCQEWLRRIHPDDQAQVTEMMRAYLAGEAPAYVVEYRLRCKDDHYKWLLGRGMVVQYGENGKPLRMIGTHVDLTERKAAEEELYLQKEYLKAIFDSEPECVNVLAPDGALLDINAAGLRMLQVDNVEDAQKAGLLSFIERSHQPAFLALHKSVMEGNSGVLEFPVNGKRGGKRWLEIHATPLRDKQGQVVSFLGVTRNITEHKLFQYELEQQARFDYLTGVNTRGYFMQQAEMELARAIRYGHNLSLFMLDIDYFKKINDSHGHKAGDMVLKELAVVCKQILREVDIIGRIGGEEFAILLPETNLDEGAEVAERLRSAIEQAEVQVESGLSLRFKVSIGLTSILSMDESLDVLLVQADKALYVAKDSGRNQVHVAM